MFLVAGWWLAMVDERLQGDALARTAAAAGAWFGRQPQLEAIGFVWAPFPALWQVAILPFARWWPELLGRGLAGVIVSAWLMAWMLSTLRTWLAECGVGRLVRIGLVTLTALHPLILLYGANGMSEAGMLCFLAIAALRLARWWESDRVLDLATAGVALGFAYLTRYEAGASIALVCAAVGGLAWIRSGANGRDRLRDALLRISVVGIPAGAAVILWAFVSWAVSEEPFAQFSSEYGNSSQSGAATASIAAAAGAVDGWPRLRFFVTQVLVFGGGAALVVLAALLWWGHRRGARVLAALVCFGGPLAFQATTAWTGTTFAWGRFAIAAVPLAVFLAGPLLASLPSHRVGQTVLTGFVIVVVCASTIAGAGVVRQGRFQTVEEAWQLASLPIGSSSADSDRSLSRDGRRIARDLETLRAGRGEIVTDMASAFPIVANSRDHTAFVIPADRDFERIVTDPAAFGARYLLVPDPTMAGFDALNAAYPTLFADGAGIARFVREWDFGDRFIRYRLYEITERLVR
jgi:hypothetical protein